MLADATLPANVCMYVIVFRVLQLQAVRKCVDRLWLVQQDFFKHVSGVPSPHPVLFRYQHMFKGIKVGRFFSC